MDAAAIRIERLRKRLNPLRQNLLQHAVYEEIDSLGALRVFMEHHAFAVWDFMSLLKALQRQLCCVATPWLPPDDPAPSRFINEIVLAEESDNDGRGGFASHFELYRRAMCRCGANTGAIDGFLQKLGDGMEVVTALGTVDVPPCVRSFVRQTFAFIKAGSLPVLASAFTFGREDLLPDLFQRVVDKLNVVSGGGLEDFTYYLHRHIGLDRDEHGPMAMNVMVSLCGGDEHRWQAAEQAAVQSLEARRDLWNGILAAIRHAKEGRASASGGR